MRIKHGPGLINKRPNRLKNALAHIFMGVGSCVLRIEDFLKLALHVKAFMID